MCVASLPALRSSHLFNVLSHRLPSLAWPGSPSLRRLGSEKMHFIFKENNLFLHVSFKKALGALICLYTERTRGDQNSSSAFYMHFRRKG